MQVIRPQLTENGICGEGASGAPLPEQPFTAIHSSKRSHAGKIMTNTPCFVFRSHPAYTIWVHNALVPYRETWKSLHVVLQPPASSLLFKAHEQ